MTYENIGNSAKTSGWLFEIIMAKLSGKLVYVFESLCKLKLTQ